MIICDPDPLPNNVLEIVERWEQRENGRLFGLITSGLPLQQPEISRLLVRQVRRECKGFEKVETLDVILDSGGGDADATYQLVTFLRSRCNHLRVFVPDWAKSAATLFCLGADEIWMSATAELGPLDAQIQDPRNPQEMLVSALEQFRAMDYLKQYSFEMLDTYVGVLLRRAPAMRLRDVIKEATPFVTQLLASLYGQVDPLHFGGSYRSLQVAVEYGQRLMARYAYRDWDGGRIEQLVNALTWAYPGHSFVLDQGEVERLGLYVHSLEGEREVEADEIIGHVRVWVGFVESKPENASQEKIERGGENNGQQTKSSQK